MIIWISLALVIAVIYFFISLWLSRGLLHIDTTSETVLVPRNRVTVLVAARNEERNLPALFESLTKQTLPSEYWNVIVINDRSTDGTQDCIDSYKEQIGNLSSISIKSVPVGIAPKKNAIVQGVKKSTGDIIAVTDADCILKPDWLALLVAKFEADDVVLVQGLTGYSEHSAPDILFRFQAVDFFSHSVVAAAGIGKNLPINSNANNFAYRKTVFEKLDGYGDVASVVSGDDDLLLQRVWEQKLGRIIYMATSRGAVETLAPATVTEMFEQRKRWGSKTVYYKPKQTAVLAMIFLFYIVVFLNIIASAFYWELFLLSLILLMVKVVGELLFMVPGTALFNKKILVKDVWWASLPHLFLIIFSVLNGVFGSFSWKGTQFSRKTNS